MPANQAGCRVASVSRNRPGRGATALRTAAAVHGESASRAAIRARACARGIRIDPPERDSGTEPDPDVGVVGPRGELPGELELPAARQCEPGGLLADPRVPVMKPVAKRRSIERTSP